MELCHQPLGSDTHRRSFRLVVEPRRRGTSRRASKPPDRKRNEPHGRVRNDPSGVRHSIRLSRRRYCGSMADVIVTLRTPIGREEVVGVRADTV